MGVLKNIIIFLNLISWFCSCLMLCIPGVEADSRDLCVHQPYRPSWGAWTLARPPAGETSATSSSDHLWNQREIHEGTHFFLVNST